MFKIEKTKRDRELAFEQKTGQRVPGKSKESDSFMRLSSDEETDTLLQDKKEVSKVQDTPAKSGTRGRRRGRGGTQRGLPRKRVSSMMDSSESSE